MPRTWMSSGSWCLVGSPKSRRLEEPPASHLQVHSSPLSQGRSPRAAPGKAVTAQRAKPELSPLLPSRASLGATLLRAAQSSCSAGEDLALQFMAGAHTGLLLSAQEQTDEVVFTGAQEGVYSVLCRLPLSQAPASRLPVSSSRRENTGAEAKDS